MTYDQLLAQGERLIELLHNSESDDSDADSCDPYAVSDDDIPF